jgi:hypothetical protein
MAATHVGAVTCPHCGKEFHINSSPETTPNAAMILSLGKTCLSLQCYFSRLAYASRWLMNLDGGGIKGYSSLLILRRVMEAIEQEERNQGITEEELAQLKNPSVYFDYIAGTSSGG